MNQGGFSWKNFSGIPAANSRVSNSIGIALTKSAWGRKIGRIVTGVSCLITVAFWIAIPITIEIIIYPLVEGFMTGRFGS